MQKLPMILVQLAAMCILYMVFSCGHITIPLTIKNEFHEPISTVIIGAEYIKGDIRSGKSKQIISPVNTVLLRIYTKSNGIAHRIFYLYPHDRNKVITLTSQGLIEMK